MSDNVLSCSGILFECFKNLTFFHRLALPAPKNLTATKATAGGINVTWRAIPDNSRFDEVIGYRVYYYDQTELRNITLSVEQTNVTIDDVKVNVNYDFTVCGLSGGSSEGRRADTSIVIWNVTGETKSTLENRLALPTKLTFLHFKTCLSPWRPTDTLVNFRNESNDPLNYFFYQLYLAPEMPPKNLSCSGSSPFTISVGWYEYTAAQTGGSLKNYTLRYNAKGNLSEVKNITLRPYPPWYTLENLLVLTKYEITVFVYNEKGFSPPANITCETKEGREF